MMKKFIKNQSGATMMTFGIVFLTLLAAMGSAIDMGKAQMARSRMSAALDAGGLAATSVANTGDVQAIASKYFNANFVANNPSSGITVTSITATPNSDKTVVTLQANATVPTSFMKVFGYNSIPISATSEITRANIGMELVLVLDITGSMAGTKIQSLRQAATDLINILYGSNSTLENFWVGMVPYVTSVNIGNTRTNWLNIANINSLYPNNFPNNQVKWKGCVEERTATGNLDVNDTPPTVGNNATYFTPYLWADDNQDNNWIANNGSITINSNQGPNDSCGNPLQIYTSSKTTILNAIAGLQASTRSGTMSNTGLIWGWRMMSPLWRGMWGHPQVNGQNTLPLDYNTPLMKKVVVIMTDGENQFYDSFSTDPNYSDYTGYKRLALNLRPDINTTNQNTGRVIINNKTAAICTAMKAADKNIIIYTITFQLGSGTAQNEARTLFQNCATKPEYYFDANTSADLTTSFQAIGDSLANMRISQ